MRERSRNTRLLVMTSRLKAMHLLGAAAAAILALAIAVPPVSAATLQPFIALLNSGQENPPTTSNAFGVAFLTFDNATQELCYSISFTSLVAAETAAHFHGPAAPGVNAAILLDISPAPPGPSPAGSPKTGCVGPLDGQQRLFLKRGLLYINVHSTTFPGGEIRGQVVPVIGVRYSTQDAE
jgi:CHRD domain-containing protein